MASYDTIRLSVLSPVASPRARESEFFYTLVFPTTFSQPGQSPNEGERISYQDAVALLRSVTTGGKERERQAVDEFRRAWLRKFRVPWPQPQDTVPIVYFHELLREVIIQRFDAIPGLFLQTSVSQDEQLLLLSFRPAKALLAVMADKLQLKVAVLAEIDPGEAYWAADPMRSKRESQQWGRPEAQEELYRMFLAGKVPVDEVQIFEGETAAMWSRRIHALKRISDPQVTKLLAARPADNSSTLHLPYKDRAALQYLYRQIDSRATGGSVFRVVDKIRLTKAIVDAEFDCDALVEQRVLAHHLCAHTHHTDAVDTSVDVLRFQWGALLSPLRMLTQRLAGVTQVLYAQPILHVRNYFGEELALYFAYASFYTQTLQYLCVPVLLLELLKSSKALAAEQDEQLRRVSTYFAVGFCLLNCAFVQVFVRKWAVRQRLLASEWGVGDLKSTLHTRPQFRGQLERSAINLRLEPYYSPARRLIKRVVSYLLLVGLGGAILFAYYTLLTSQVFTQTFRCSQASLQTSNMLLAVLTKCVGVPLAHVSKRLNDWENYRTQVDYDTNLTLKFALLQTANGFGMLWYMAFLSPYLSTNACGEAQLQLSCRAQAAQLLMTMLSLDLVFTLWELRGPLYGLLLADLCTRIHRFLCQPKCLQRVVKRRTLLRTHEDTCSRQALLSKRTLFNSEGPANVDNIDQMDDDDQERPLEAELALDVYEGVMFDYAQVIMSFGFVAWFAALDASSYLVAWAVAVLQLRIDTYKLSNTTQRPFPTQKSSIGSWLLVLRFLSLGSLLHNAAIATMLWVETLAPSGQRIAHLHDLLRLRATATDAELLLVSESEALAIFSVFAAVWGFFGLPDRRDHANAKLLARAKLRQRFLENKFLKNIDRISDAVKDSLPTGRVFLNGVHRYIVTGDRDEEDAAEELFDELRQRQLCVLDVEKRIAELREAKAEVGVLYVEVVGINILPIMDALTKAVDSFVQLRLKPGGDQNGSKPKPRVRDAANTSVMKKNRSPQWHEKFEFTIRSLDDSLTLSVFDWELLGKNRRIGQATLQVVDVVARTFASVESESPTNRQHAPGGRKMSAAAFSSVVRVEAQMSGARDRASLIELVMGSFELPIEMPEALLGSMHVDLLRHGHPRLLLRCGVQLRELGELQFQRRRLHKSIEGLKKLEKQFFQWTS